MTQTKRPPANPGRFTYIKEEKQALSLNSHFNSNLQDSPISKLLANSGYERTQKLAKLSGRAFDEAYARNELAYHILIMGALEVTLTPSAKDAQIKRLMQNELALFQKNLEDAKQLADQFEVHMQPTPTPPRRDYD